MHSNKNSVAILNFRKECRKILALLLMGLALAACGGGDESISGADAPAGAPPGASAPAPAAPTPTLPPVAAAGVIAITAKGVSSGPIASMVVSAAGGTLVGVDGRLTLTIPPGALPAGQTVSIEAIGNESPGGSGPAYRLRPDGQTFSIPVKLTFNYGNDDVASGDAAALRVAFQDEAGRWNAIRLLTLDESATTLTVETTHFSDWALNLQGFALKPKSASIDVSKSVDLEVVFCDVEKSPLDGPTAFALACTSEAGSTTKFVEWAVNGVVGGTGASGRVASSAPGAARFTAPAAPPPVNPAIVSVTVQDEKNGKLVLIAKISVGLDTWAGTASTYQTVDEDADIVDATLTLRRDIEADPLPLQFIYFAEGTVRVRRPKLDQKGCTYAPTQFTIDSANSRFGNQMVIDFDRTRALTGGAGVIVVTQTITCPPDAPYTRTEPFTFFGGIGVLSADGLSVDRAGPVGEVNGQLAPALYKFVRP